ncbi:fasciclin domain-containing protein, partial [Gramella jeungdoensis]
MKKLPYILTFILTLMLSIGLTSCNDDDDDIVKIPEIKTIADFVVANSDNYSSLLAALQKANLVETLSGDTMYTVFAPNNDAFAAFLTSAGFDSLDDVPVDVLTQILLNHVVAGNVQSGDLATGYVNSLSTATPNGANMSMYIDLADGVKINGIAKVTA